MLQATAEGNDTLVRQLLAQGAPANMRDERGATALMIAARNGDLGLMQALLSRGADPSITDNQGQTVFGWAEPSPTTAKYVTAFLLDRGISKQPPRPAAPPQSPQVKASLTALAAGLARVPPASASVRDAQRRASGALSQLQSLSARWPADSPDDYRDNLSGDVMALDAALKAGTAETLAATLQAIADDLEVKLEHCSLSGGKLGGSVVVRVRTVAGAQETGSWQVFYMPRVFEAATNASPDLFPQLSSPTVETLVPGRYVMWVRDPTTARLGERTVVKVGEGKKELLLDLPVPSVAPR
jgi:ankyrin repeat protein